MDKPRNMYTYRYNKHLATKKQRVKKDDIHGGIAGVTNEEECKCIRITGHLEAVEWLLWSREYKPSPGYLALGDWTADPNIWLYYVESCDGLLPDDDVLMTTDTRYWSIHDVQRYFLSDLHCEKILFTCQYPNLRMPTPLGSYLWRANTNLKLPPHVYQKELYRSLEITLKKMEATQCQMDRLIVSDQLFRLDRLDYFKRKTFFRIMLNLLQMQESLQLVSFENLCCERLEGVRLIQQLACFNADSLKYLFLWKFFETNQNPLLINYSYITVMFPCVTLFCIMLPVAGLLGFLTSYIGGLVRHVDSVVYVKLNEAFHKTVNGTPEIL